MKKYLLCFVFIFTLIGFFGCQKNNIKNNISEKTEIYFYARCGAGKGSISIGKREHPYIINGSHEKNVDFSLIILKFNKVFDKEIEVEINVNEMTNKIILELNPLNSTYMTDLGYALNEDDKISISYQDYTFEFENIGKNFKVDGDMAIEIGLTHFNEIVSNLTDKNSFNGECYLKVMTRDDEEKLYWLFTIVDREGNEYNLIINVMDENDIY